MSRESFVFCACCKTMFLESAVIDNCCPACKCNFDYVLPEYTAFDPFEPLSWPFGKRKVVTKIHSKSSTEQFWVNRDVWVDGLFTFIFLSLWGGIMTGGLFFVVGCVEISTDILIILRSIIVILAAGLFWIGLYCLDKIYLSIDSKNVYITQINGLLRKAEIQIPRDRCRIITNTWVERGLTKREIKLEYSVNADCLALYKGSEEVEWLDQYRWLSTYLKYAYNEDLLPEPEMKYGKALPPADEVDTLNVDEEETLIVQDEM